VAGKRDERRWRREAMTDTLVTFLDASFAGAGQRSYDARSQGEDLTSFRKIAVDSHALRIEALTRRRWLAPAQVVVAAERLHNADNAIHIAVLSDGELPELDQWATLRQTQRRAREDLLTAARGGLGLDAAQSIGPLARITTITDTTH